MEPVVTGSSGRDWSLPKTIITILASMMTRVKTHVSRKRQVMNVLHGLLVRKRRSYDLLAYDARNGLWLNLHQSPPIECHMRPENAPVVIHVSLK